MSKKAIGGVGRKYAHVCDYFLKNVKLCGIIYMRIFVNG